MSMISICLLSWERHDMLVRTLNHNLSACGHHYELLVCDQGSKDVRVKDFIRSKHPAYFRENSKNEGIAHSFNQLYLRAKGSYIALMSNDILWPAGWGQQMVAYADKVPNSGIVGIPWWDYCLPPKQEKFGVTAHYLDAQKNRIFGPTFFKREVVEKLGLYAEEFGPYGGEDSDFNERVNRSGLNSFYIPGMSAEHIGWDVDEQSEYRKMKDKSLHENAAVLGRRLSTFDANNPAEPLPPMRDPL